MSVFFFDWWRERATSRIHARFRMFSHSRTSNVSRVFLRQAVSLCWSIQESRQTINWICFNTWILKYQFSFLHIAFSILDFFQSFDWCQCFIYSYIQCVSLEVHHIFKVVFHWIVDLLRLGFCVVGWCGNYSTKLWCCMDRLQVCGLLLHWWCGLRELMSVLLFFNNADKCICLWLLQSISQAQHFHHSAFFCWFVVSSFFT